jgi:hypothetical protein
VGRDDVPQWLTWLGVLLLGSVAVTGCDSGTVVLPRPTTTTTTTVRNQVLICVQGQTVERGPDGLYRCVTPPG